MNKVPTIDEKVLIDAARVMSVQKDQISSVDEQLAQVRIQTKDLSIGASEQSEKLDELLKQAETYADEKGIDLSGSTNEETGDGFLLSGANNIKLVEKPLDIVLTEVIEGDLTQSWDDYISNVYSYMDKHHLETHTDPYLELLSAKEREQFIKRIKEDYYDSKPNCDKWDYLFAALSGLVAGLVDSFFVGTPKNSILGGKVDFAFDTAVEKIAKLAGWKPHVGNENNVNSAIGFLERNFKINYDQINAADLGITNPIAKDMFGLYPKSHHIKSLAHSPDLVGLVFSIIDQFTDTASFISGGKLLRISNESTKIELKGNNVITKILAGTANWFMHILSDIAGSSGKKVRGSGVPIPGFELFQFLNFGNIDIGKETVTFAEFAVKMFENGYDARFGVTMAIPVVIAEMLSSICWLFLQRYHHNKAWKDLLPCLLPRRKIQPELIRMHLVTHGCLCLTDAIDAAIRSGGPFVNPLGFAMHLNLVALGRFALAGLQEVRAIYGRTHIDLKAIDKDTSDEWQRLTFEYS